MTGWGLRSGKELRTISRELKHVGNGREIKKRMTRELRAVAAPFVPAVRAAVLSAPVKGEGSTGLRARLARATRLQVRTVGRQAGVRILVDPKRMPDGEKALPEEFEGTKRWRHPVYGNRDVWITQDPKPFFFRTVRPLGPASRVAVGRILDKISKDIT